VRQKYLYFLTVSFSAIFPYKNPYPESGFGTGCSIGYVRFLQEKLSKNNHVKIVSLFSPHYLHIEFTINIIIKIYFTFLIRVADFLYVPSCIF